MCGTNEMQHDCTRTKNISGHPVTVAILFL
jgi:hypothetical protein